MTNPFDRISDHTARYFTHRGINCMTQLGPFTINGYIELPENHPWLDKGDLQNSDDVNVHGGISYHEGRVIGFDTNQFSDGHHPDAEWTNQAGENLILEVYGEIPHIWTWEEVEDETRRLADQAKDAHHA